MKDAVKEIRNRLLCAEQEDGHLSRRDCWALLCEIYALRKTIEKIYEYSSVGDTPGIDLILNYILKGWKDEKSEAKA